MIEELISGAGKDLIGIAIVGPICVILGATIAIIVRMWRADMGVAKAEINKEREAHEATRQARIEDLKSYAAAGEAVRAEGKDLIVSIKALMDLAKQERTRA